MPARFEFPFDAENPPQIWMPVLASRFSAQWADQRGASFLKAIGRLRPGVALPAAQSELSAIAARIDAANPRNGAARASSSGRSRTSWSGTTGRR